MFEEQAVDGSTECQGITADQIQDSAQEQIQASPEQHSKVTRNSNLLLSRLNFSILSNKLILIVFPGN